MNVDARGSVFVVVVVVVVTFDSLAIHTEARHSLARAHEEQSNPSTLYSRRSNPFQWSLTLSIQPPYTATSGRGAVDVDVRDIICLSNRGTTIGRACVCVYVICMRVCCAISFCCCKLRLGKYHQRTTDIKTLSMIVYGYEESITGQERIIPTFHASACAFLLLGHCLVKWTWTQINENDGQWVLWVYYIRGHTLHDHVVLCV